MAGLQRLEQLATLDLSYTPVTRISTLARMRSLRRLELGGTRVSDEEIQKLARLRPELQISRTTTPRPRPERP